MIRLIDVHKEYENGTEALKGMDLRIDDGEFVFLVEMCIRDRVYVLSKDEGGRHTPFFNNYRPQFYFRTTDVTGVITLPEGTEMCMPGDNVDMNVELITPIAIEKGLRFAIREGGRTVGSGVVIDIAE